MLQSPQPPPTEPILISLINDVTISPTIVLVLDDYHLIDSSPVDNALNLILENLPPQMHLVVATRTDPQLPLARLRARGQLAELRAEELRFTLSESSRILEPGDGPEPIHGTHCLHWKPVPKVGLQACNWLLFPCKAARIWRVSLHPLPVAIVMYSTI